jgi:hypothetical protein
MSIFGSRATHASGFSLQMVHLRPGAMLSLWANRAVGQELLHEVTDASHLSLLGCTVSDPSQLAWTGARPPLHRLSLACAVYPSPRQRCCDECVGVCVGRDGG